jgi:hypothetical protein
MDQFLAASLHWSLFRIELPSTVWAVARRTKEAETRTKIEKIISDIVKRTTRRCRRKRLTSSSFPEIRFEFDFEICFSFFCFKTLSLGGFCSTNFVVSLLFLFWIVRSTFVFCLEKSTSGLDGGSLPVPGGLQFEAWPPGSREDRFSFISSRKTLKKIKFVIIFHETRFSKSQKHLETVKNTWISYFVSIFEIISNLQELWIYLLNHGTVHLLMSTKKNFAFVPEIFFLKTANSSWSSFIILKLLVKNSFSA